MYTWHPISFFNFGYPSKKGHFASYLLEDSVAGGLGYDVYRPDIWNHFCFTFNATSSVVRMALVETSIIVRTILNIWLTFRMGVF